MVGIDSNNSEAFPTYKSRESAGRKEIVGMADYSNEIVTVYQSRERSPQISRYGDREKRDEIQRVGW